MPVGRVGKANILGEEVVISLAFPQAQDQDAEQLPVSEVHVEFLRIVGVGVTGVYNGVEWYLMVLNGVIGVISVYIDVYNGV